MLHVTKHLRNSIRSVLSDGTIKLQPYVGLGVNHTFFFEEDGAVNHLGKSWGLSYSAGLNYGLGNNLLANVAVWKIDIDE